MNDHDCPDNPWVETRVPWIVWASFAAHVAGAVSVGMWVL